MTNLAETNINLTTLVEEYSNHLLVTESYMETMQKTIRQRQGEIKPLKKNLSGQTTNKIDVT